MVLRIRAEFCLTWPVGCPDDLFFFLKKKYDACMDDCLRVHGPDGSMGRAAGIHCGAMATHVAVGDGVLVHAGRASCIAR